MSDSESDQEIADGVLPEEVVEPAIPVKLGALQPWHSPRKQYIRTSQWQRLARQLITKLRHSRAFDGEQEELRYLTLPGPDYLDVRVLAECCSQEGCYLTSVGFHEVATNNRLRARAEVREDSLIKAGHITDRSHTVWKRIEEISHVTTPAYKELVSRGPFHIVNIDACGSPALPSARHSERMIDAIYRIVEYQLDKSTCRWMMYITVDVRKGSLDQAMLSNLISAIRENANASAEFKAQAMKLFGGGVSSFEEIMREATECCDERFVKLFSLGLSKWLLHLAESKQWGVKMHKSYYYSTSTIVQNQPTMPCLALEFIPPAPGLNDLYGVTTQKPKSGGSEEDLSLRTIEKVGEMQDLDYKIAGDAGLRRELIAQTGLLLREVGYPASEIAKLEESAGVPAG